MWNNPATLANASGAANGWVPGKFSKPRIPAFKSLLLHARRDARTRELNISATQVFVGTGIGLCLMAPLIWVFIRYWLFAV
jgi:hypothetical protein